MSTLCSVSLSLSGGNKQDAVTTTSHSKRLIEHIYWHHHSVQYGKILMVVQNNIYVPL